MGLSPQEVISRRAFDDRVIRSMLPSSVLHVEGYKSSDDIRAGRTASELDGSRGRILYYAAWYRFPVLIGPGETMDGAVAVFNANVHDYPYTRPIAHITSKPLPWSPHVKPNDGIICQGDAWPRSRGRMLLAHAIVHVSRLLNCDEKERSADYVGYNAAAMDYWRRTMRCRPLTPDLEYPVPAVEVTHGVTRSELASAFCMLDDRDADEQSMFRIADSEGAGFQLIGGY